MSVFLIIVGYLVGAIPFAFLLTRQFGSTDLRYVGSGNAGAANVLSDKWFDGCRRDRAGRWQRMCSGITC